MGRRLQHCSDPLLQPCTRRLGTPRAKLLRTVPVLQFVRRMGVTTDKPYVMCRPSEAIIMKAFPEEEPLICPATVADRVNMGWAVRYYLTFDDDVVSRGGADGQNPMTGVVRPASVGVRTWLLLVVGW